MSSFWMQLETCWTLFLHYLNILHGVDNAMWIQEAVGDTSGTWDTALHWSRWEPELNLWWLCWFAVSQVCISGVFPVHVAIALRDFCQWSRCIYAVVICASIGFCVQFFALVFKGREKTKPNQNHRDGWWKAARITRDWGTTGERRLNKNNSFHQEKWSLKRGIVNDYKYIGQIGRGKKEKDYLN